MQIPHMSLRIKVIGPSFRCGRSDVGTYTESWVFGNFLFITDDNR